MSQKLYLLVIKNSNIGLFPSNLRICCQNFLILIYLCLPNTSYIKEMFLFLVYLDSFLCSFRKHFLSATICSVLCYARDTVINNRDKVSTLISLCAGGRDRHTQVYKYMGQI